MSVSRDPSSENFDINNFRMSSSLMMNASPLYACN